MGAKQVAKWTVKAVKDELPDVTVKDGGDIHEAVVRGRRNKFAGVSWGDNKQYTTEVAWETVVHCLNFGKPITVS
jgi:S-adenosylhomocysteine hydrolase